MLVGVGLIMLFSASFPSAYYEKGNPAYYLIRQGLFAVAGIVAMAIIGKTNYERFRGAARIALRREAMPEEAYRLTVTETGAEITETVRQNAEEMKKLAKKRKLEV